MARKIYLLTLEIMTWQLEQMKKHSLSKTLPATLFRLITTGSLVLFNG
jgi:hypothetical protein